MEANERPGRTWLSTVVFVDIVNYSNRPVSRQIELKERLNRTISHAITHIAPSERIILDTGDGAALCFVGDPEEAFFTAIDLLTANEQQQDEKDEMALRIGVNLGPVKIVRDLNQNHNILGDGINVAQRVMSFASPNQILVSRSFYEVIAPLSQDHARLFQYLGVRKDKHIREHSVYEVLHSEPSVRPAAGQVPNIDVFDTGFRRVNPDGSEVMGIFDEKLLNQLENELAFHIGPLARVLVKQAAARAHHVGQLCETLAGHIPVSEEKENFLAKMGMLGHEKSGSASGAGAPEAGEEKEDHPGWNLDLLQEVEVKLAQYLGPVAKFLLRKEEKRATDLEHLYRLLAQHLTSAEDRQAFLRDVSELGR